MNALGRASKSFSHLLNVPANPNNQGSSETMLSILRKARLKDKEMRILMLYG